MAEVTGMTAEAIDALMADMIVSADIDENGQMIFTKRSGATVNAGAIVPPAIAVEASHPVGSIFISISSTNPAVSLGIGAWSRFGQGRMLVGLDDGQAEFNTPQEVGGTKTETLDLTQIPTHAHGMAHTHDYVVSFSSEPVASGGSTNRVTSVYTSTSGEIDRSGVTGQAEPANTGNAGGAAGITQPVNNLPPYIVVYMWRRTA